MRVASLSIALLAAFIFVPSAHALFENVEFTSSAADAADYPPFGFLDFKDLAFGEPGDNSVIFRYEVVDATDTPPSNPASTPSLQVFYTVGDTSYRSGVDMTGAPVSTNPYDACSIEGNFLYCTMKYSTIKAAVGGAITAPHAISYAGLAQDVTPGNLYADESAKGAGPSGLILPVGTDYVLKGSTVVGGGGGGGGAGPIVNELTTKEFKVVLDQTTALNQTYLYHWANTFNAVDLAYDVQPTAGSVDIKVVDSSGKALLDKSKATGTGTTLTVDPAAKGKWNVTLAYAGFTGKLTVTISEHKASGTTSSTGPASGSSSTGPKTGGSSSTGGLGGGGGGESSSSTKGSPGVGVLALVAGVAFAVVAIRRRL